MSSPNRPFLFVALLSAFSFCVVVAAAQTQQSAPQAAASQTAAKNSQRQLGTGSEGEKRFEANCGRCHTFPEDLSPREARAVLRQMRVRAMLSAEDERLILKYIAP
ncbi:MAG TPA: cytochrome c [Candidatus Acidoferrales bacterium]|nr:cytochrome c [Candidatus Acidoferrales bacterium]